MALKMELQADKDRDTVKLRSEIFKNAFDFQQTQKFPLYADTDWICMGKMSSQGQWWYHLS